MISEQKFEVLSASCVGAPGEVYTGFILFVDPDLAWYWVDEDERPHLEVGETATVSANSGRIRVRRVDDEADYIV